MPKIRGVKPDYWTDEAIVDLTIPARLLLIGLWNYACDNGHLQDKPKQIKMRIFPGDDVNATELLRELEASGRIVRGGGWITIPNLTFHQKPDRRYFTTCDKAGCEDPPEKVSQRESRRVHGVHTPGTPSAHGGRTAGARVDGEGDGEGEGKVKGNTLADKSAETDAPDRFDEFWDVYAKKVKRADAERKWAKAIKKADPDRIIAAAHAYVTHEREHNQGGRYIADPSTWLHGERWRDERADLPMPQTRVQEHLSLVQQLAAEEAEVREIGARR